MTLDPARRLKVLREMLATLDDGDGGDSPEWVEALSDAVKALEREQRDATPIGEAALRAYYVLCEHFTDDRGAMGHDGHWHNEEAQEVALEIDRALFTPAARRAQTDAEQSLQERVEALEDFARQALAMRVRTASERADAILDVRRAARKLLTTPAIATTRSAKGAYPPGEREP